MCACEALLRERGAASTTGRSLGAVLATDPATVAITCDVVVVGAGPAGTAAAIELQRGGRHVVVVDKAVFPRDKCCGDGLTTLALRELEHLGLDPATVAGWRDVSSAWLRSPSGREVELPLPTDGKFAAVAPRQDLDDALVRLARTEGVDIRDGCTFSGLDRQPRRRGRRRDHDRSDARRSTASASFGPTT